jgi:hypothetical protein
MSMYSQDELNLMIQRAIAAERLKASGSNPGIAPTGPNGLFVTPGLEPDIPSTYIPPKTIEGFLEANGHVRTSVYTNPIFGIITGQTASTGEEPTEPCDENVRVPGNLKLCQQTWRLGEFTMKSQVIRIDKQGELENRGSPVDMRLINNPFAQNIANQIAPADPNAFFRNTVAKLTLELANGFTRDYAKQIWNGDPVNTAGSSGGYLEFTGLNKIVNTGYQDSITQVSCPASDSLVLDFNNAIVQNDAVGIVRNFVEAYRDRKYLAEQTNFGQVNWAWVMRKQLFLALTEVWPCAYYTYRCYAASPTGNATAFVDTQTQVGLRDSMRNGYYLLIDGEQVPVIIDNAIDEINNAGGNFTSNAYLLPLSAPGRYGDTNGQLLYMEYFDYRAQYGMQGSLGTIGPDNVYRVSGDGRFITMLMSPQSFCRQILMRTSKRIILRTPFLAARIDNIQYNVYIHERDYNADSSFYVNGGNTSYEPPTYYSPVS